MHDPRRRGRPGRRRGRRRRRGLAALPRFAAFLRGINVGGHRITNDELRSACEAVGLRDVATFRASGNVIFAADDGEEPGAIADRIETGLGKTLGYGVPVFLRTRAEVLNIAAHQPFEAELVDASAGKLQVSLLAAEPSAKAKRTALALANDEDRLAIRDRELYWLPSGGQLESELDHNAIEAALGLSTRRTKGTMEQVAAKFFAD